MLYVASRWIDGRDANSCSRGAAAHYLASGEVNYSSQVLPNGRSWRASALIWPVAAAG